MATLRDLFPTSQFVSGGVSGGMEQTYVYNTSFDSTNNGGRCCLWTVPTGVTWARFEVWGGGGGGAGACCCQQPRRGAGGGAYVRKTIEVNPGDSYRICAAGSTSCSPNCCGQIGFPSYVVPNSVSGCCICLCAQGGYGGCTGCFMIDNGCIYSGMTCCRNGSYSGTPDFDFGLPAMSGGARLGQCGHLSYEMVGAAPYLGHGLRNGWDYCHSGSGCQSIGGWATFPGGGGGSAISSGGGCCWGNHGGSGLVIITYR